MNTFERAFNDPDKSVRSAAYHLLCDHMDDATVVQFVPRIVDLVDTGIRIAVVSRIWRLRATPENVNSLTLMLKDTHSQWRASAACTLWRLGESHSQALAVIRTALQNKKDDFHETLKFVASVPALAKELLPEIVALAGDQNPDFTSRNYAIGAIGQCGSMGVPYLLQLLEAPEAPEALCQIECIYALANIGKDAQSAIPHLRVLLNDSRVEVRRSANEALVRIDPTFVPQEKFETLAGMPAGVSVIGR